MWDVLQAMMMYLLLLSMPMAMPSNFEFWAFAGRMRQLLASRMLGVILRIFSSASLINRPCVAVHPGGHIKCQGCFQPFGVSSEEMCDDPLKALRGLAVPVVGASSRMILQNTLSIYEGFFF